MRKIRVNNKGFIAKIVLIIVAIIALKYYFHFDVLEWIKSTEGKKIVEPAITTVKNFYSFLDNLVKGWVK